MASAATRQRALEAALALFSQKGYQAVSMNDIAGALGIKAPSLYKYFSGKEELYAALTPLVDGHYQSLWASVVTRNEQLERDLRVLGLLTAERLEQETGEWLRAELGDPQAGCFRRLMALNQFENPAAPQRWLWEEPLAIYEGLFDRLIAQDVLRRGDPHVMAVEFFAPLIQLLNQADRSPGQGEALLEEARRHIRQFHRVFAHREPKAGGQTAVSRLFRR